MKLTYKISTIFLCIGYVIFELIFFNKVVGVDDPWYSNVAWNFAQGNGLVDTIAQDNVHWVTFLYPLILGVFFKVFGTTVFVGRLVSLLGGLVALVGFVSIQRLWKIRPSIILTTGILFIVSNMYTYIFCLIRPEAWCIAFVSWGLFFLAKGARDSRIIYFIISALFTCCAVFCHANAALFALFFGLFAFGISCRQRSLGLVIGFGVTGLLCVTAWVLYYTVGCGESLAEFLTGQAADRTALGGGSTSSSFLSVALEFAKNYSGGIKRLYLFVFEVGVLVVGIFFVKHNRRLFLIALCGLSYFLIALLVFNPFFWVHFGEVVLFSVLATGLLLEQLSTRKVLFVCFSLAVGVYGLNAALGSAGRALKFSRNTPFDKIASQIEELVPENATVLSSMPFWFGLKHTDFYSDYTRWEQKGYGGVESFIKQGNPTYVVLSSHVLDTLSNSARLQSGENADGDAKTNLDQRMAAVDAREMAYYKAVMSLVDEKGIRIGSLDTEGYGTVFVWKIELSSL